MHLTRKMKLIILIAALDRLDQRCCNSLSDPVFYIQIPVWALQGIVLYRFNLLLQQLVPLPGQIPLGTTAAVPAWYNCCTVGRKGTVIWLAKYKYKNYSYLRYIIVLFTLIACIPSLGCFRLYWFLIIVFSFGFIAIAESTNNLFFLLLAW